MSKHKKILLTLPKDLLSEIDKLIDSASISRSEFIRDGIRFYIQSQKREHIRKLLEKGYQESGMLNLQIAEDCLQSDNLQLENYLEMLSECEK